MKYHRVEGSHYRIFFFFIMLEREVEEQDVSGIGFSSHFSGLQPLSGNIYSQLFLCVHTFLPFL